MKSQELLNLASEFDSPLYVYDAEKIEAQYKRLTNAFSKVERFRVHYAVKALSNLSILKYLKSLGSCLDTVSIQEVQLGLHAGFEPYQIIYGRD
jgi:diaminopimelate decarboxylase